MKQALRRPIDAAFDLRVEGGDRLPLHGPVIVVANHRSFIDSIFLAHVAQRPLAFLAKAEYFDDRRTAWMFRATGQIPVRRGSPGGAKRALDAANTVLDHGGAIAMFPEGTRSRDGLLHGGNLGAARLAIATGAPILPVGLIGTAEVQPIGRRLPRPGKRVYVRFGDLLYPDCDASPRGEMRDLTHHMMEAIGSLCGQSTVQQRRELVLA